MKNMFKLKTSIAILSLLAIIATGCLKDKYADQKLAGSAIDQSLKVVELLGPSPEIQLNLTFKSVDTTLNIAVVNLASDQPLDHDIQVTVKVDTAYITAYNAMHAADPTYGGPFYTKIPTSAYKVASLVVTIPKGKREGYISFTTNPSVVANQDYAIAFTIVSVSDPNVIISGNHATQVFPIGVKNKYDANYKLRIRTVGWGAFGIADGGTYDWPSNGDGTSIFMITSGTNSVDFFDTWGFGDYIQVAFTTGGAGATGFGATAPRFTFDPATDKLVSVINVIPPDSRNRLFRINPAVTDSRFDPATKSIYAAYILSQTGRPDQFIYDTLRYVSSR